MWRALGDPVLHFAIIRGAIQKGKSFSWIFCQFSPFRWSNFDLELIYFTLSMNTSSCSPIASGTYNRWKVEFVLKTKMTETSIQRRLWWNFIHRGLVVPIFVHSRSLLFEGNASLKCVYSGLKPLLTVFKSYHDGVWLVQGAQCGLGGSHFDIYNWGFPSAFICLSFMLMAADFSRTQYGYSVHVFSPYYIVIDLEAGQYFVGRFQNLDYMHY